jgi:hypothetical protein
MKEETFENSHAYWPAKADFYTSFLDCAMGAAPSPLRQSLQGIRSGIAAGCDGYLSVCAMR